MPDADDEVERVRRFAAECDAIALRGAAADCAERLAAINATFDVEHARREADEADRRVGEQRLAEP